MVAWPQITCLWIVSFIFGGTTPRHPFKLPAPPPQSIDHRRHLPCHSPLHLVSITMLRQSILRAKVARPLAVRPTTRSAHAISNPTLANIEKRWESMPPQEQADLWMALRDRMKTNWTELTVQEKKAGTCRLFFGIIWASWEDGKGSQRAIGGGRWKHQELKGSSANATRAVRMHSRTP